jgi:hypothetical protein
VLAAAAVAVAVLPAEGAPSRPPVVLVIFDELPGDALLGRGGRIDAKRYPAFAELARTGWWFKNAHTVFDFTRQAVPLIFDGRRPTPGGGGSQKAHPQTIYDVLGLRGYRMVASEDVTALCPRRWCPGAPVSSPDTLKALAGGRPQRLRRWIGRIRPGPPTFYVKHTLLPHVPYMYLPSGRRTRNGVRDPIPGMNGEAGFGDSFLTRHNEQRFLLQLGFVDRQLGALIRRLRRARLYDRALIVVTADHGGSFETGVSSRREVTLGNVDEVGPVPFFVKRPGQRRGRTSRALVRTLDVMPTIADVVNAPIPYSADGRSAFGGDARGRRFVRIPTRDFSRTVQISGRAWERRRRAVVRRRLRRYGSGDLPSLYTGIGPNRDLIGDQLAELEPAPAGRVRAAFEAGGRLRRVRPGSGLMPTQLAGTIRGGRRGARRNLAVAVNGRVEVVGRTWRLRGQRPERFALNLPEAALLRGRNRVVLMEVRRGGRALRILGRI